MSENPVIAIILIIIGSFNDFMRYINPILFVNLVRNSCSQFLFVISQFPNRVLKSCSSQLKLKKK